jgi:hypothetical protein
MESTKMKTVMKTNTPEAASDEKRHPLKTFTQGDVSASVWARDHLVRGESRRFYSVTFERSYRDATGQFRYARSFNPGDLGALMWMCDQASKYLEEQQAA